MLCIQCALLHTRILPSGTHKAFIPEGQLCLNNETREVLYDIHVTRGQYQTMKIRFNLNNNPFVII